MAIKKTKGKCNSSLNIYLNKSLYMILQLQESPIVFGHYSRVSIFFFSFPYKSDDKYLSL